MLASCMMVSSLSGCMFLSDSQKTAVDVYMNKKTPNDMLEAAEAAIQDANYLQCQVNYRIEKINQDKSMSDVLVDADSWELRAIKGADAGYWKGSSTRDGEPARSETTYVVKKEDGSGYELYKTPDLGDSWIKEDANGVWSGLTIMSVDYKKLLNCEGLQVDKEPVKKDGSLQWRIFGTLTDEQARGFLAGLEDYLNLHPDDGFPKASTVDFEMFMNTDDQPVSVYMKFNPESMLETSMIYTNWEVRLKYVDYDAYSSLTIPKEAKLKYISQEDKKEEEQSFLMNGTSIKLQETTEAETEFQLDEDDELLDMN